MKKIITVVGLLLSVMSSNVTHAEGSASMSEELVQQVEAARSENDKTAIEWLVRQ